jgi:hypothetical protein
LEPKNIKSINDNNGRNKKDVSLISKKSITL